MALQMAPSGLATHEEAGENSKWRSTFWNQNAEPNVPGIDDNDDGDFTDDDDYEYDLNSSKMWQTVNQDRDEKIYFDLWNTPQDGPHAPHPRPDGTSTRNQFQDQFNAHLGFWRDCNGDGFVGSATTGAQSYSINQLHQEADQHNFNWQDVCPVGDDSGTQQQQIDFMYNDGTQVDELLPIGANVRDTEHDSETFGIADQSVYQAGDSVLCPSQTGGPSGDNDTKPGHRGSGTPRADESNSFNNQGTNGNVACYDEGRLDVIQDDFAEILFTLGAPHDEAKPTSTIVPLPDGATTDSNGLFWYVDNLNLGGISVHVPGLWPSQRSTDETSHNYDGPHTNDPWDPREPNQCDTHQDPTANENDVGADSSNEPSSNNPLPDGPEAVDNVGHFLGENAPQPVGPADYQQRVTDWAEDESDLRKSRDSKLVTCSPVANMQYIDVDGNEDTVVDRFAWPLHIAEDRIGSDEKSDQDNHGITNPWSPTCEGESVGGVHTGVKGDPSTWDNEGDADPIRQDDEPHKLYGPNHDGSSVWPPVTDGLNMIEAHLGFSGCDQSGGGFGLESYTGGGVTDNRRTNAPYTSFGFNAGDCFNPAHSPGIASADTYACVNEDLFGPGFSGQAGGHTNYGHWDLVDFIDVPNEPPDFYFLRTLNTTAYADVSFGYPACNNGISSSGTGMGEFAFDPFGDDPFYGNTATDTADTHNACFPLASNPDADQEAHNGDGQPDDDDRGGVYDSSPIPVEPGNQLPGDEDNAHQFGDVQCSSEGATGTYTDIAAMQVFADSVATDDWNSDEEDEQNIGKWICDREVWRVQKALKCHRPDVNNTLTDVTEHVEPDVEQLCWTEFFPGDPYDLWDVDCFDNDVANRETTTQRGDGDPADKSLSPVDINRDCDDMDDQAGDVNN